MTAHDTSPGHGRPHGHGSTDIDWDFMAAQLEAAGDLQLPVLRAIAARLRTLHGAGGDVRRIVDAGSGPGVMTCVFAAEFGAAEAVAADGSPVLLDHALARAERLGLGGRVAVRHAELPGGLASDVGTADLVWSSKAVHHIGDQQDALRELAAVLRPGGLLAVAEGGLPMRFLPRDIGIGRPGLQARLDAAAEDWYSAMRAGLPGSTAAVEDWPAMLTAAGLAGTGSFTEVLDLPATESVRAFLHAHLVRLRDILGGALDADDRRTLDVLADPDAPQGVRHRPDVFLLAATTVFAASRPE
ncbi:class I SAM-dependent methyltransferase [Yinghuangia soli]|uniref:Class I SAM-dependent methyltransferase n=1 Tax=Yinghuangia soli TaxID=2908204 RepID=A0AA41U4G4_9ACTN|nr:methyltransferase domain-containing protein [Yinghuangia soli]MCF2532875.1 class I SAM-dependent methyltransferase [Yinghuangia soli]